MNIAAIILVGGPNKGTRFRPLSLDTPKHLFPIAGHNILQHQVRCLSKVDGLKKIFILGNFPVMKDIFDPLEIQETKIEFEFIDEEKISGTAGALHFLYKHSDIRNFDCFIISHGDIVCDYPFMEMVSYFTETNKSHSHAHCILETKATKTSASCFGVIAFDHNSKEIMHYVEKPNTFISSSIYGGIGIFGISLFDVINDIYQTKGFEGTLDLGIHIFDKLIYSKSLYAFEFKKPWVSVKSPNGALHANKLLLSLADRKNIANPSYEVIGNCFIHPLAIIESSAGIGPNVSIESGCVVHKGVRISNSIILNDVVINENTFISDSIIGLNCTVNSWCRIQGKYNEDYFEYFTRNKSKDSYFTSNGHFDPCVTVLGSNVHVKPGIMLYNSVILQYKEISASCNCEIIL